MARNQSEKRKQLDALLFTEHNCTAQLLLNAAGVHLNTGYHITCQKTFYQVEGNKI